MLVVPHSRIFDVQGAPADADLGGLVDRLAEPEAAEWALDDVVTTSVQSISLNVSSSCNLSCSYCYASRGGFSGAQSASMDWDTARAAIDALLARADPRNPVTVGFMGGEPFVRRALLHRAVHYASDRARALEVNIGFSITTNGTLLQPDDIALIRSHRMAITVSIDGGASVQDSQRPGAGRNPGGSHDALARATAPLLADPGLAKVAARATVLRTDMDIQRRFDDIVGLGFREVGFSPLRADKGSGDALQAQDWPRYFEALKKVAEAELRRARAGGGIRLTNLATALKQMARGASSPYPCGAGGGYFSVGADGRWYACHRAIGVKAFDLGDSGAIDAARREAFLSARHVHAQEDCRTCWARYLCSGSCHQEAAARSASSCDFIRSWLEFCLAAYCELTDPRVAAAPNLPMEPAHGHA